MISRLKTGGTASVRYLTTMSEGLSLIIAAELGQEYDYESKNFKKVEDEDWIPSRIIQPELNTTDLPYTFHSDGRRSTSEKVAFMKNARKEVVFIGVRMRQFVNYFFHRRDEEFADHIEGLLSRGVNVKCYLLDYQSNAALLYFRDLSIVSPQDENGDQEIASSLKQLTQVKKEFTEKGYPGELLLFTYRNVPFAHYLVVDGGEADAKMQVAHYLYGQPSAKVPVLEVWRARSNKLFDIYWAAARLIIAGAREYNGK